MPYQYAVVEVVEGEFNTFSAEMWPTRPQAIIELISRIRRDHDDENVDPQKPPLDPDDRQTLETMIAAAGNHLILKNTFTPEESLTEYAILEIRRIGEPCSEGLL